MTGKVFMAIAIAAGVFAQTSEFEVASVKPSGSSSTLPPGIHGGPGSDDPSRLAWTHVPLSYLISTAFNVPSGRIAGPAWLGEARFDIVANLPSGATGEQVKEMLRNLLKERFHLAVRREAKVAPVYALTVVQEGPRLPESSPDPPDAPPPPRGLGKDGFPQLRPARNGVPVIVKMNGKTMLAARNLSSSEIALLFSNELDRPVVDETGLKGRYDVTIRYSPENARGADPSGLPSMKSAIQAQLGLRLEPKQGTVESLVVERVDRNPTDN